MAMSKIAELKGKIGLVSGTRSIVDSLLFTNSDILAKYMKENFRKNMSETLAIAGQRWCW